MNIEFESEYFKYHKDRLVLINDVYEGANKVINEKYLVKKRFEDDDSYEIRQKMSSFYNYLKLTVRNMNNILFKNQPEIDYKSRYKKFFENIDGQGSNLSEFVFSLSERTLLDGMSFVWIDYPEINENLSLYEKNRRGLYPKLHIINRLNVPSYFIENINGETKLTQIVISQKKEKRINRFETEIVDIKIVLNIGRGEIYEKDSEGNYNLVKEWKNNLNYIPVIPVYSDKQGVMKAEIPFYDLAKENLYYMNRQSSLANILDITSSPVPTFFKGEEGLIEDEEEDAKEGIKIGPSTAMVFTDKTREGFEWKETQGIGIEQVGKDLVRTKERMEEMSLTILYKGKGVQTATEAKIRDSKSNIFLLEICNSIEKAINIAINIAQDFSKDDYSFKFVMNKSFLKTDITPDIVDRLLTMRREGTLSRDTMWDILIKGEFLPKFDKEAEKEKIKQEEAEIMPELGE